MGVLHSAATGDELHVPGYTGTSDPGAVGAFKDWFNPDTRTARRRNTSDNGWTEPNHLLTVKARHSPRQMRWRFLRR